MNTDMETSVASTATEAESSREERKPKRTPKPKGSINWKAIRKEWNSGMPACEIAEKHDIGLSSIYAQAKKEKWIERDVIAKGKPKEVNLAAISKKEVEKAIESTVANQMPVINTIMRERLNQWFERILATSDKLQRQIETKAEGHLEVEEIKSLSSSAEVIDRVARRTFGLDSPSGSSVSVFSVASPSISCPVIDVEALPLASPSSD